MLFATFSRVSFWMYFRLVRVYLGDQRMRRVKDQDGEGKGPGDQEDPGTRGPRHQRTRGPEEQGTRGPGDQRIRGTLNCFSSKFIFISRVLGYISSIIPFKIPLSFHCTGWFVGIPLLDYYNLQYIG